jgi:hypothetical protein
MYATLFRAVTKTVTILQDAQCETEEMYLSADAPNITVLEIGDNSEDNN